jgi:hypothetical protein
MAEVKEIIMSIDKNALNEDANRRLISDVIELYIKMFNQSVIIDFDQKEDPLVRVL